MQSIPRPGSSEYLKLLGYKRYHYLAWPQVSSSRLVLLHGLSECADIWSRFASRVSGETDVVAPDLRGHGGTPWDPDANYRIQDYVEDLVLQVRHWGRSSVLIGNGLGGQIALIAARELGDLVTAIAVIETDAGGKRPESLVDLLAGAHDQVPADHRTDFKSSTWQAIYRDLTWARPGGLRTPKCDPAALAAGHTGEMWNIASEVRQPALVILGEAGNVPGANSGRLADCLPLGRMVQIPGGGWPHVQAPSELAKALQSFLAGISG